MEEELIGIEENDYEQYQAECPYCHNIVDIDDGTQESGIEEDIRNNEIVEVYCDKCESYFEAQLA